MAERALNAILTDINTQIKTVSFGSKVTTRGLSYLQEKDGKTFPLENNNTKNGLKISWDDKYPLQTYHRILGVEKESDNTQGFGNKSSRTTIYSMRLVGIGSKASLSAANYEDNQEIAKAIEEVLPPFITTSEYLNVESSEVIKQNVYDSEWAGSVNIKKLSLEGVAFWIDYTLKITGCGSSVNFNNSASVYNSDGSYSSSVACRGSLEIPDITITLNDDSTETYPAAKNIDLGIIDPFVPVAPVGWDAQVAEYGRGYNYPLPTGHETIYRNWDDASVESTVFAPIRLANSLKMQNSLVDFMTLGNNNSFGNKNRFTDINGLQIYGDDYVIDNYTGLGWYRTKTLAPSWDNAIDDSLSSNILSYNDWFLPSYNMLYSIWQFKSGTDRGFRYAPFLTTNIFEYYWTSTTDGNPTTSAIAIRAAQSLEVSITKTSSSVNYIMSRKHF